MLLHEGLSEPEFYGDLVYKFKKLKYSEGMFNQCYPPELQLNKANSTDTGAPFLDLHLSSKINATTLI